MRTFFLAVIVAVSPHRLAAEIDQSAPPVPLQTLDDVPLELDPARPRTEEQEDQLHATALYSAGRLHERQLNVAKAVKLFQRAIRYDPDNRDALLRLVYYLDVQKRLPELARYAVLLAKTDRGDARTLYRAIAYLMVEGRQSDALKLYEQKVKQNSPDIHDAYWIQLHKLVGQEYLTAEKFELAAKAYAIVEDTLNKPDEFGLGEGVAKRLHGDNPAELWVLVAEAFLKAGQVDRAEEVLKRVVDQNPKLQLADYAEAQIQAARGNDRQALKSLESYFDSKATEQGEGPYRLLEEILTRQKKADTLIERLEGLQKEDPHNLRLGYFLASRYVAADQESAAQQLLENLLTEQLTEEEIVEWLGGLEKLSTELGAAAGSDSLMKKVVATVQQRIDKEEQSFDQNLAIALLASDAGDLELAAEYYKLAAAVDPDQKARVYEIWGMSLEQADNYPAAAKVFRRAIDEKVADKDDPRFHFYLSRALAIEDQFDEALKMALYAVEKDERNAQYRNGLAWIHYLADRRAEAINAYQSMLEDFDSDHSLYAMREYLRNARYLLSVLYARDGNLKMAAEMLEQVLDEYPDDVQAANDLGYLWADEAVHLKRAHRMILYAVKAEPDNIAYRDSLGWVLHRLGRNTEALVELKRAVSGEDDPDGVILDHLADVQHALGQEAAAKESWQRAISAFEKTENVEEADKVKAKLTGKS